MNEHHVRALLRGVIQDLDAGHRRLPPSQAGPWRMGGTLLAAALGLSLSGCGGSSQPADPPPQPAPTADPGPVAPMYGAPAPEPTGADPVGPPAPEYAAPAPVDPGPKPMYGVEPPPGHP